MAFIIEVGALLVAVFILYVLYNLLKDPVHLVANAGHMPFFEQPTEFFSTVLGFLDAPDRGA